jgi:uncharacterized protein DUF6801
VAFRVRPKLRTGVALTAAVVTLSTAISTASSADPTTSAGATAPAPVSLALHNACEFPVGGPQAVTATFTALLPESVFAGDPIELDTPTVKFVLPEAMIKALRDNQIASVEGIASVGIGSDVAKQELAATVTIPKTPLPETGDLTVELPAKLAPQLTTKDAGIATLTVEPLETLLMSRNAAGEAIGGADVKKVTCTLDKGQDTKLGTVNVVPAKPPAESESATPSETATPPATGKAPKPGKDPRKPKARLQDGEPQQGCGPQPPDAFTFWTYYPLTGHATVKKLEGGVDFGPPGYMSAQLAFWFDPDTGAECDGLLGDLLWPPARGKFIAYHFLPTEATVKITQTKTTVGVLDNGIFIGTAETDMQMSDVTVNGTPLAVGPKCKTASPVALNLRSKEGEWNPVADPAGFMEADFDIPAFAGCGVTEDLDPLFTGLITGPGNHIRLDFGNVVFCSDVPPDFDGSKPCVPQLPDKAVTRR